MYRQHAMGVNYVEGLVERWHRYEHFVDLQALQYMGLEGSWYELTHFELAPAQYPSNLRPNGVYKIYLFFPYFTLYLVYNAWLLTLSNDFCHFIFPHHHQSFPNKH